MSIRTASGQVVFSSPAPVTWDSSARGAGLAGPGVGQKVSAVGAAYGARSVRLSLPSGLAAEKFPVYVDPSYSTSPSWTDYGEIQSAFPEPRNWTTTSDGNVTVGYVTGIDRGNYVFGLPDGFSNPNADILSATLSTTVVGASTSASTSHTVGLYYTSDYTSTSSWDNPPTQLAGPSSQTFTTASTTPSVAFRGTSRVTCKRT